MEWLPRTRQYVLGMDPIQDSRMLLEGSICSLQYRLRIPLHLWWLWWQTDRDTTLYSRKGNTQLFINNLFMTYWVGHWRTGPGSKLGNLYYIQDVPQKCVDGFKLSQSVWVTPCTLYQCISKTKTYLILALWLGWEWDQVLEDHWLRWWAG